MPRAQIRSDINRLMNNLDASASSVQPQFLITNADPHTVQRLADDLADDNDCPLFVVDEPNPTVSDVLGEFVVTNDGDDTTYSYGPLPKALKASHDEQVILCLPDLHSIPFELHPTLHSTFDTPTAAKILSLDTIVEGNSKNLVIIAGTPNAKRVTNSAITMTLSFVFDAMEPEKTTVTT